MSESDEEIHKRVDEKFTPDAYRRIKELEAEVARLKKREEEFWWMVSMSFDIETREEFEELAKSWEPENPMVVAVHHMWKRDAKVDELSKGLDDALYNENRYKSECECWKKALVKTQHKETLEAFIEFAAEFKTDDE